MIMLKGACLITKVCDCCGYCVPVYEIQDGFICRVCLKEYVKNQEDAYIEDFIEKNRAGFYLTFLKGGKCLPPLTEEWWIETIHNALKPDDLSMLKKEYTENVWSDFGDFVLEKLQKRTKD